jgi:hypothetical protein
LSQIFESMAGSTPCCQPRASVAVNTFTPRLYRKVLGAALGAVVAGLALTAGQAKALVVTVNGQDWDVTTFTGSYGDNVSKFETAANGGVMPWWGSQTNAEAFALAVGPDLGLPNAILGPFYGFSTFLAPLSLNLNVRSVAYPRETQTWNIGGNFSRTWAQATPIPANVPGPLPILGLAAAFGFSRKLRKRIKLHKDTSAVSTSTCA